MSELRDVAAKGARIRFFTTGDGPPLLLLHDVLRDRSTWDAVVPALARRARVIAPDLPGFGESEKPRPARYDYTHDAFVESLVDLTASLELGRMSVCGHGLGAAIAILLAARHPTLVERVMLVSPTVYEPAHGIVPKVATLPIVGQLLFTQVLGKSVFKRQFSPKTTARKLDDLYESFTEPAARAAAHATLVAMRDPRPVVARLASVRAPSLVVGGREHAPFLAQGRRLARELNGRYDVLECGHAPHEEQPDAFSRAVLEFFARPSSRGRAA